MSTKKFLLEESEIPTAWYNIAADMKQKPLPLLHPGTRQPIKAEDLYAIFAKELAHQEVNMTDPWIEIPDEVRELYKIWRPTPLVRATGLEKALDTPAHIYFKNESVSPVGSHKLNSALAQDYFCKKEGVTNITTETGAGQWGAALAYAAKAFELELAVYMVKISYDQKPYRRSIMQTFGAVVIASPSMSTKAGRKILTDNPNYQGSLGTAISEALELAMQTPNCKYTLGSVLNHVMLHQTVIGLEAEKQMEMAGEYPDIVIGCFGGGSNFSGISFPFLRHKLNEGKEIRIMAAEPVSCPKLTRGQFQYDFGDEVGYTPLIPMFTLGHSFAPANIHAGGLRYHGAGAIVSQLRKDGFVEAVDIDQLDTFAAAILFSQVEGIIPAPESAHAIAAVIREAEQAKKEGRKKTILFNLSGHGLIDMAAYDQYISGDLSNHILTDQELAGSMQVLEQII
jgi:tryptophan synthase beta chain